VLYCGVSELKQVGELIPPLSAMPPSTSMAPPKSRKICKLNQIMINKDYINGTE
jgi:hypothetical protein